MSTSLSLGNQPALLNSQLMTHSEVYSEKREGKSFHFFSLLDLNPPYSVEVVAKPYPMKYAVSQFQKFDGGKGNIREHFVRLLDSMGAFAHDTDLCMREFSKYLTDKPILGKSI